MEEFLADSSTTIALDNNNVVDNLEVLKQNPSSTMETAQQIDSLVKEQEVKTDDLLNLNDQIDNTVKFENLIETPKNKTESTDLSESTIQLLEDLNDTANTNVSDLSKNTTNPEHSSTVEAFLEQSTETASNNALIDNLSEDNKFVQDLTTDSIQSQSANPNEITQKSLLDQLNDSNLTNESIPEFNLLDQSSTQQINLMDISNLNEITQESLLDQSNDNQVLNSDNSRLKNESIQEINLPSHSSTQEISLVDISDENDQIEQREKSSLLCQKSKSEETDKANLLNALVNNDKENKSEFLEDLTKKMDKKIDELISNLKPEDVHQAASEQSEDQAKLTFEDFVTKNEEIKTDEPKDDNLLEEETIIGKKLDEEVKEKNKPEIVDEIKNLNLDNQEVVASESKANDILTQSQELLRKADKLIAEKRNSINEINIPGLDVKISPNSIIEEQSANESENSLPAGNKPSELNKPAIENAKAQKNTRKCVIS